MRLSERNLGQSDYTDRRIIWFGFGILGFIFLSIATVNTLPATSLEEDRFCP